MTATSANLAPKKWTPSSIDGNNKLKQAIDKLESGTTQRVDPAISCRWSGRIHGLTYIRREKLTHAVLAWIEEPGAPPFELYREERSKNAPAFYLPVRQWVPLSQVDRISVPPDINFYEFIDWRVEQPRYPVSLRDDAIVEPGTEKLWERVQGKRLQAEGFPRLHHHERQLYRLRVAMWESERYCGSVAVPVEWLGTRD